MWNQGEHVALVGDTGSGKTFLLARMLRYRSYTVVLRTKDDDIKFPNTTRITRTVDLTVNPNRSEAHYLLDPPYERQAIEARRVMDKIWTEGGWTLGIDETWYLDKQLHLGPSLDRLLTQGRSKALSLICGMQRPAQISRFVLSQCTHLFAFASEGRDVQTLAEAFTPQIKIFMPELRRHEFLYWNRNTRILRYGYAQDLDKILGVTRNVRTYSH